MWHKGRTDPLQDGTDTPRLLACVIRARVVSHRRLAKGPAGTLLPAAAARQKGDSLLSPHTSLRQGTGSGSITLTVGHRSLNRRATPVYTRRYDLTR
jgi:hypothetical protein